ncbi:MAG: hypothetical protein IBJ12_07575 [Sphingomonadaceae bacterium]|nr:hypothetical protein [Sphingomonadaceae bacterium]
MRRQRMQHINPVLGFAVDPREKFLDAPATSRQPRRATIGPKRDMAAVAAQYAVIVLGLDLSPTVDGDCGTPLFHRYQGDMVVVRVVMFGLDLPAVDIEVPAVDFLPRPVLRPKL